MTASVKRTGVITDDERGPDSVECFPGSFYEHSQCIFDFRDSTGDAGFLCGCRCHDIVCARCHSQNGEHRLMCPLYTALEAA